MQALKFRYFIMETTRSQIQYFSNLGRDTTSSDFFFLVVDNLLKFRQNRLTTKRYQNELCTCYHGAVRNAVKKKKQTTLFTGSKEHTQDENSCQHFCKIAVCFGKDTMLELKT